VTDESPVATKSGQRSTIQGLARGAAVLVLLYFFLVGVNGLSDGFKSLGGDLLETFFNATANPFVGLMVGILATTLVQSSSVTTSMIVGLVAADINALPIENAIPMVMGANIGTTVTNTIVSMAHMGRRDEFRRAFAVATCHDFFNFMAVAILLPSELLTGYLQKTATWLASEFTGIGGMRYESPIKGALKATVAQIQSLAQWATGSDRMAGILLMIISAVLIFTALLLLVRTLRSALQSRVETIVSKALEQHAMLGMLVGLIVTVMVQSSSITTSLLVPLAGASLITLHQAFPVTLGANVGTTVTALLAALAVTGGHANAGITIALVHLLFNVSGIVLIFPIERIRQIPLSAARGLANTATKSRRWALVYVAVLFYGLPALIAVINNALR
jgi:sodium-dependent phosphate cotransporter